MPRSTVSHTQPVSHISAELVVPNSLHSHDYKLNNEYRLYCRRTLIPILIAQDQGTLRTRPVSIDHGLPVHHLIISITASQCISELLNIGVQMHLQTRSITASKCISELMQSPPPSVSLISHDYGLQVFLWVTQSRPRNASSKTLNHVL
jgi:hypothetical protein